MKIDFNNARRQLGSAYNDLVNTLNERQNEQGIINIFSEDIERSVNDLRMFIGTIMCVYEDNNEEFKDMYGDPELMTLEVK